MTEKEMLDEAIQNTRKTMLFALWHYLTEDEFNAFNKEVQIHGRIRPETAIYKKAYDFCLVKQDGYLWDLDDTKIICSVIVFERDRIRARRAEKGEGKK